MNSSPWFAVSAQALPSTPYVVRRTRPSTGRFSMPVIGSEVVSKPTSRGRPTFTEPTLGTARSSHRWRLRRNHPQVSYWASGLRGDHDKMGTSPLTEEQPMTHYLMSVIHDWDNMDLSEEEMQESFRQTDA